VTCYLLCFINDEGEHVLLSDHAGHYLGETGKDVDERRDEHQAGRGAKLTAAAAAAGITFVVARTWPGRYPEERRLKGRRSGSRELKEKCPNCHPMPRIDRWAGGKPAWARKAETEPGHHEHRDQRHPAAVTRPRRGPRRPGRRQTRTNAVSAWPRASCRPSPAQGEPSARSRRRTSSSPGRSANNHATSPPPPRSGGVATPERSPAAWPSFTRPGHAKQGRKPRRPRRKWRRTDDPLRLTSSSQARPDSLAPHAATVRPHCQALWFHQPPP
jgi:predicted GIY-YIG superfamily endonuclease